MPRTDIDPSIIHATISTEENAAFVNQLRTLEKHLGLFVRPLIESTFDKETKKEAVYDEVRSEFLESESTGLAGVLVRAMLNGMYDEKNASIAIIKTMSLRFLAKQEAHLLVSQITQKWHEAVQSLFPSGIVLFGSQAEHYYVVSIENGKISKKAVPQDVARKLLGLQH